LLGDKSYGNSIVKMSKRFKIIDIGHKGFSLDRALTELELEVSDSLYKDKVRAIKVIHGHGTGTLQKSVREWCQNQEGRFQAVINGEDYDLFDQDSANMRADCGSPYDFDLGKKNSAITYIWFW
jgi:hypothetical protein